MTPAPVSQIIIHMGKAWGSHSLQAKLYLYLHLYLYLYLYPYHIKIKVEDTSFSGCQLHATCHMCLCFWVYISTGCATSMGRSLVHIVWGHHWRLWGGDLIVTPSGDHHPPSSYHIVISGLPLFNRCALLHGKNLHLNGWIVVGFLVHVRLKYEYCTLFIF